VARGQALGAHAGTDLTELAGVYGALARGYREEYVMYNLPAAALAQVPQAFPMLRMRSCFGSGGVSFAGGVADKGRPHPD